MSTEDFVHLEISQVQLDEVKRMLREHPALQNRVIVRAINNTLAGAKTDTSAVIRTVLAVRKTDLDKCIATKKADVSTLSGKLSILGKIPSLIAYSASQVNKGVSVKKYVDQPRQLIEGAFIATVKAGDTGSHTDVFKRAYKGIPVGRPVKKAWGKMPSKYRLPIEKMFGPRITTIAKEPTMLMTIQVKAAARLTANVDRELNYELLKLAEKA